MKFKKSLKRVLVIDYLPLEFSLFQNSVSNEDGQMSIGPQTLTFFDSKVPLIKLHSSTKIKVVFFRQKNWQNKPQDCSILQNICLSVMNQQPFEEQPSFTFIELCLDSIISEQYDQ